MTWAAPYKCVCLLCRMVQSELNANFMSISLKWLIDLSKKKKKKINRILSLPLTQSILLNVKIHCYHSVSSVSFALPFICYITNMLLMILFDIPKSINLISFEKFINKMLILFFSLYFLFIFLKNHNSNILHWKQFTHDFAAFILLISMFKRTIGFILKWSHANELNIKLTILFQTS